MQQEHTAKRRRKQGLCTGCGGKPEAGRAACASCLQKNLEKQRRSIEKKLATGLCVSCGKPRSGPNKWYCVECCGKIRIRERARKKTGKCARCQQPARPNRVTCAECSGKMAEAHGKKYRQVKQSVFDHYGGYCKCCGETTYEFLAIDHINGGGTKHREALGGGTAIYRWLVKNNFPEGFQILCHNCNLAKGFFGECPHERARRLKREQEKG